MNELIDRSSLGELKNFIQDKFPYVVETYLTNASTYVDSIQKGAADNDWKVVVDAAHPLKSSSGNLGLMALHELCEDIEQAGNEVIGGERNAHDIVPLIEKIGGLYAESSVLLKAEVD